MSLILSHTENKREPIEAGNHIARCVQLIDLGTQIENAYESEEKVANPKIRITWELPNEISEWEDKDTKEKKSAPRLISKEFKASLHEKSGLRKALASWRGRDFTEEELKAFDLRNILNKPCMINITHEQKGDKTYDKISAIAPLAKGTTCPDAISTILHYDINDGFSDTFKELPEFMQKKIRASVEISGTGIEIEPKYLLEQDLPDPSYVVDGIEMPY